MSNELFESLEHRQLMAVDLSIGYNFNKGKELITSTGSDTHTAVITVRNSGKTSATSVVQTQLFASLDKKYDSSDWQIGGTTFVSGVKAGRTVSDTTNITLPTSTGRYYIIAVVDQAGIYNFPQSPEYEPNRSNNTAVSAKPAMTIVPSLMDNTINGTDHADKIGVIYSGDQIIVGINGTLYGVNQSTYQQLTFNLGGGSDKFATNTDVTIPMKIFGGSGNDRISAGAGQDSIYGEAGSDRLFGGAGDDLIDGGTGNDRIFGNAGTDYIYGGGGNDYIYVAGDNASDKVWGDSGVNSAQYDDIDFVYGITTRIL